MSSETPHQPAELLVAVARGRGKRVEREAVAKLLRPRRRLRAERAELDGVAWKTGSRLSVRLDVENDGLAHPREQFRGLPGSLR